MESDSILSAASGDSRGWGRLCGRRRWRSFES